MSCFEITLQFTNVAQRSNIVNILAFFLLLMSSCSSVLICFQSRFEIPIIKGPSVDLIVQLLHTGSSPECNYLLGSDVNYGRAIFILGSTLVTGPLSYRRSQITRGLDTTRHRFNTQIDPGYLRAVANFAVFRNRESGNTPHRTPAELRAPTLNELVTKIIYSTSFLFKCPPESITLLFVLRNHNITLAKFLYSTDGKSLIYLS